MTHHQAIVLGAGIGGLLAARALSPRFDSVIVVERDELTPETGYRRSIPQGRHAHGLLARGHEIIEDLFPGITDEIKADKVPSGDLCGDCQWIFDGLPARRAVAGLPLLPATRPVLERHIRRRVTSLPNVHIRDKTLVEHPMLDQSLRVTGVRVFRPDRTTEELPADLVIDSTGRGSRLVRWLRSWGFDEVAEDRVDIDLAYTTRKYQLQDNVFGSGLGIIPVAGPKYPRGGFFYPLPGGDSRVCELSLTGIFGDHAPTDPDGFEEFARSLPIPELTPALETATPLTDPVRHTFPHSYRLRFERLTRHPHGILAIGDAVCSFNPVYGQGMTAAAMGADLLAKSLSRTRTPDTAEFYKKLSRLLDAPWSISAGADMAYPQIPVSPPVSSRLINAYVARLQRAAFHDADLSIAFMRAAGLVAPPTTMMTPRRMLRVLRNGGSSSSPMDMTNMQRVPAGV